MTKNEFITHACEQVLRFSTTEKWESLSEEHKVQLGFNMGVMALGLELSKEEGYKAMASMREGATSISEFREHIEALVSKYDVPVKEENINRPY